MCFPLGHCEELGNPQGQQEVFNVNILDCLASGRYLTSHIIYAPLLTSSNERWKVLHSDMIECDDIHPYLEGSQDMFLVPYPLWDGDASAMDDMIWTLVAIRRAGNPPKYTVEVYDAVRRRDASEQGLAAREERFRIVEAQFRDWLQPAELEFGEADYEPAQAVLDADLGLELVRIGTKLLQGGDWGVGAATYREDCKDMSYTLSRAFYIKFLQVQFAQQYFRPQQD
ncbi:hypothetical protein PG993_011566 [Apiospora rasikravindrae]|uniref:Uncharacterized protein n=1 Tax=Apiospora rasikravindrae TaxID=990691 RepID=A0ABR1RZZ9_9PEZI